MKIYFLSSQPCALRFNGVYFGVTDHFERFAEVSLSDRLFVEFSPQNANPICFFLTEDIRFSPPKGCTVYLLPNAIAIYAKEFQPIDCALKIIAQKRFTDNLVTVFQQGPIQLSLETEKGFFVETLPPSFSACDIDFHNNLFFIKAEKQLAIYTKAGKCVFLEEILEYSIEENTFNATLPLSDRLGRQAKCSYSLTDDGCYQTGFLLQQYRNQEQNDEKITDELLPYAFFESVLIGAEYNAFFSDELLKNADKIRSFLGDFKGVTLTQDSKTCGLIYQKAPDLYEITYYTVELEQGKITDVHR